MGELGSFYRKGVETKAESLISFSTDEIRTIYEPHPLANPVWRKIGCEGQSQPVGVEGPVLGLVAAATSFAVSFLQKLTSRNLCSKRTSS